MKTKISQTNFKISKYKIKINYNLKIYKTYKIYGNLKKVKTIKMWLDKKMMMKLIVNIKKILIFQKVLLCKTLKKVIIHPNKLHCNNSLQFLNTSNSNKNNFY